MVQQDWFDSTHTLTVLEVKDLLTGVTPHVVPAVGPDLRSIADLIRGRDSPRSGFPVRSTPNNQLIQSLIH